MDKSGLRATEEPQKHPNYGEGKRVGRRSSVSYCMFRLARGSSLKGAGNTIQSTPHIAQGQDRSAEQSPNIPRDQSASKLGVLLL